jgi:branched-chain amino acid aminotransferase
MTILVSIDGRIVPPEEAKIPVFDRGFLYGDSIYEVIRTHFGVPFALEEHLERLGSSARLLGIELPLDARCIRTEIQTLLSRAQHAESYIRIIVTRGEGEIDLDPGAARTPHTVIIMQPLRPLDPRMVEHGVSVLLVPWGRSPSGAVPDGSKTGNYLANLMALGRARREGHQEAILLNAQGHVAEGASSNVFTIRSGIVATPSLSTGILAGITRSIVIDELGDLGLEARETTLTPGDLYDADEVFLTSTLRDVLPVVRVDDRTIGSGRPGRESIRIRTAYLDHVAARVGHAGRA